MANGQHDESRGPIERASRVFPLRLLHTEPARCGCGCGSGYLQCGSPDVHAALERAKLLLGQQIEHLVIGVYHETHMILVIVDPYFMPFAAIQSVEQSRDSGQFGWFPRGVYLPILDSPAMRVNHQFPCGARAERKIECQLIIAG